jgi:hypothetical protein
MVVQNSHPYNNTGNIAALYTAILVHSLMSYLYHSLFCSTGFRDSVAYININSSMFDTYIHTYRRTD